ncbi:MAG: energy-coupled thiamine transporter ThiT [Coriobacteriia bacterium]|nr:energy-coupled thiamine transporter ThiT [Coriobacteriia bacterium]
MTGSRTRILVEIALVVALATVLDFIKVWQMPMGGTVSLGMLPILVIALRRGLAPGLVAGALSGVVALLFNAQVYNWAQFLLDYPLAFAAVGGAGSLAVVWRWAVDRGTAARDAAWIVPAAVMLGAGARLFMHWESGILFFAQYAPAGQPGWLYSLIYNGSYMLPSGILCAVAAAIVLPALEKAVPVR